VPVSDTALMQVFSSVLVTPEWLGIREAEGELDLSQYMNSVSCESRKPIFGRASQIFFCLKNTYK
jgi:hypothetical protein